MSADHNSRRPFIAAPEVSAVLRELGHVELYKTGTVLFSTGDQPKGAYLILTGSVRLSLPDPEMNRCFARVAKPDCVLGLPSSITTRPYSLSAKVVEESHLVFIPVVTLQGYLKDNPSVCFDILEILAEEIRQIRKKSQHRRK